MDVQWFFEQWSINRPGHRSRKRPLITSVFESEILKEYRCAMLAKAFCRMDAVQEHDFVDIDGQQSIKWRHANHV